MAVFYYASQEFTPTWGKSGTMKGVICEKLRRVICFMNSPNPEAQVSERLNSCIRRQVTSQYHRIYIFRFE